MCIQALITEQARRSPDAIATSCGPHSLSYRQLERDASQLASYLRHRKVGKETIVGVALKPSCDVAIAVLGILKSGAAYLPLELSYPTERIRTILADAKPPLVITSESVAARLPDGCSELVQLDADQGAIVAAPAVEAIPAVNRNDLAYAIYTSGSTGLPKGVLLEHGGLRDMAVSHARTFQVHAESRVLQFAPLGFDASISEIFTTLVAGGCLVFPPGDRPNAGQELIDLLQDERITSVLLPPSTLRALPHADLPQLETLIAGGERCTADVVQRWAPGRSFFNAYGPTETTVTATMWRCNETDAGDPPIGHPRDHADAFILDEQLQPVSNGSAGELCVAGTGLARGYLNRPQLTQRAFAHVVLDGHSRRIYRTGDVARQRPDGAFEFVGRLDRQAKIRGFRIELEDVETHLNHDSQVASASVRLEQPDTSHDRLIAYVLPKPGEEIEVARLRERLSHHLPEFMLPSKLILVDELPSDDVANSSTGSSCSANRVAPNTAIQTQLFDIWCEVLGTDEISVHDHFVELGGDSLLSAQVADRAAMVGLELTPNQVLRHPTIAKLAELLES